ncbi:hypothetical protein ACHAW5_005626 [Stephanodiscus triporus]|uniref:Phospholipase/carboxylesterase/thioesterase domain-containing protein n=1 Tax=Stephanodiscus triporus TaxID=2934178 RepID=A0ABD3PRW9_9STRA
MMRSSLLFATSLTLSPHARSNNAVRRVRATSSSFHLYTTNRGSDGTIVIAPDDDSRHSASVILCHVTLNMGMAMPSWYDIVGLDSRSNEVCNGLDDSVDRIMDLVEGEIAAVNDDTTSTSCNESSSLDYSRIVLAGFSQGGALALYAGMTQNRRKRSSDDEAVGLGLAGIVVMMQAAKSSKERVSSLVKESGVGNGETYEVRHIAD